jgi:hypothetical protein
MLRIERFQARLAQLATLHRVMLASGRGQLSLVKKRNRKLGRSRGLCLGVHGRPFCRIVSRICRSRGWGYCDEFLRQNLSHRTYSTLAIRGGIANNVRKVFSAKSAAGSGCSVARRISTAQVSPALSFRSEEVVHFQGETMRTGLAALLLLVGTQAGRPNPSSQPVRLISECAPPQFLRMGRTSRGQA